MKSHIRAMLDLSTAHVPGPEPDWGDLKVQVHEYGWIVWVFVPGSPSPDWMKPIMKLAYQKNCALILFDSDADEWEDTELHKVERFPGLWSDNSIHESGWYAPKEEAADDPLVCGGAHVPDAPCGLCGMTGIITDAAPSHRGDDDGVDARRRDESWPAIEAALDLAMEKGALSLDDFHILQAAILQRMGGSSDEDNFPSRRRILREAEEEGQLCPDCLVQVLRYPKVMNKLSIDGKRYLCDRCAGTEKVAALRAQRR